MMKLLIVYNKVWSYRVRVFEVINEHFDLTVAFTDPQFIDKKFPFKTIYTPGKNVGPFFIHNQSLKDLCSQYDAVLAYFDIRWLSIMRIGFFRRKYSLTYWGIGVTASYKNRFDQSKKWDRLRYFFAKRADSLVFYSDYPINKFVKAGFDPKKLFVANNTTNVSANKNGEVKKESFLFVGTLYKQKGIEVLLEAYKNLNGIPRHQLPLLNIIGEGPERLYIEDWIKENDMQKNVFLHGAIYDVEELRHFYEKSIACISPNQAGLSVLTSMGYATVFVTEKNAITGGEIFNIKDKVNGIIYSGGVNELQEKLIWIITNKEKAIEMGKNAGEHYYKNRMPEHMANSLVDAVNCALKIKNQ
jgi:glycosyltransferase involved in cell wall biosynthesis